MWEPVPHEPPPGIVIESLDGQGTPLRPTHFPALLSQALGGVVLGLKVLVGGVPGAGKSTLCAELAAQIAERLDGIGYWLDAEQNKDLVRELFPRTSSSPARIRLVSRRGVQGMKVGWREALQAVPPDAAVIVVDSLQRWARSLAEQTTLLEAVAAMVPTALVVSHFNKAGQFAGPIGNEYDVDATAIVRPKHVEVTKCRWSLCPRVLQRPESSIDDIAG
ncbi:hypothetical protein [Polyangium aurulentum]|uniref:hypothetical protein n=1 Tax=Polyangium aurulentum TaxID=2567896 RepID=UPI0010AE3792|nr:hypothetical protein [Polyangium aurulentum]UQA58595.1 DNA repair protein RadA [Polyangium aurulentum]